MGTVNKFRRFINLAIIGRGYFPFPLTFMGEKMSGQIPVRAFISGISLAKRCEITIFEEDVFSTGNYVRLTDLDGMMPVPRGMDQINNNLYLIEVTTSTTFLIKDPITHDYIDSTEFTPYVSGGRVNLDHKTFIYEQ